MRRILPYDATCRNTTMRMRRRPSPRRSIQMNHTLFEINCLARAISAKGLMLARPVRSLGPAKELPFKHRLTFAPAAAVWGQMDRSWTDVARTSRTAETITTADYVALFCQSCCQYLGYTDPVLAPIAQNSAGAGHAFTTVITSTIAIATAGIGTSLTSIWGRRCCVSFALSAIPPAEECAHQ